VDDDDDSTQHRPSSLLENLNAATLDILGAHSPTAVSHEDGVKGYTYAVDDDPNSPDASNFARAETPSDAVARGIVGEDEMSRPAHARHTFGGGGDGELAITSGQEIEILDDRDHAWWYVRDPRTGKEGVVPSAYLY